MIFDLPVRIRWDADPPLDMAGGGFPVERTFSIFQAIREASPLSLDITVVSGEILEGLMDQLTRTNDPISVSIYLSEGIVSVHEGTASPANSHFDLIFHAGNCSDMDAESFWFSPDPANYRETFNILDKFLKSTGKRLVLRNPNFRKMVLSGDISSFDFAVLKSAFDFGDVEDTRNKKVVVHDYFLWKFFRDYLPGFGDKRAEFDGCQGGATLAYIDWEGVVYPCETLLIPLGKIPNQEILDIWSSPERKRIAERIRSLPAACEQCGELQGCLGGCRGLSHHLMGTLDLPDPQCFRKR